MKKSIKILIVIIVIVVSLIIIYSLYRYMLYKNDYINSIYVMTDKGYYEVNDRKNARKVNKFASDEVKIFNLNNCTKSYINRQKNIVSNELSMDTCEITLDGEVIVDDNMIYNILNEIVYLEHDLMKIKIIQTNKNYYVVTELNVNLWSPYEFYYYDKKSNKLKYIYTFDDEEIIGVKEN